MLGAIVSTLGIGNMSSAVPKHPLDPLTSDEIVQVASLLKSNNSGASLHFKAVRCDLFDYDVEFLLNTPDCHHRATQECTPSISHS